MKKFLPLIISLFALISLRAQWVTIPDPNFLTCLQQNGLSSCLSGNQLNTSCAGVTNLHTLWATYRNINNLSGIQYFTNLDTLYCGQNKLTALPALPASLKFLDCNYNQITTLPTLPSGLFYLNCAGNDLTSLPPLPATLRWMDCQANYITSFTALPASLSYLMCYLNQLTTFPPLPASLTYLNCQQCGIDSLPSLPTGLRELHCGHNSLKSLPPLPDSLRVLDCYWNALSTLPAPLPQKLNTIICYDDFVRTLPGLSSLPALPDSLKTLEISNNILTSLPALPEGMLALSCIHNKLSTLPALPSTLTTLSCGYQTIVLPALPDNLQNLYCQQGGLTSLPALPLHLKTLFCNTNPQLQALPALPASLQSLYSYGTDLLSLPPLPDSLMTLNLDSNYHLYCLPPIKKISSFSITLTGITCLPNAIQHYPYNIPVLDTMPICNLVNPHGCEIAWNIEGDVFKDDNGNCIKQSAETKIYPIKVNLYKGGSLVESGYFPGSYSFKPAKSTYRIEVDTSYTPFYPSCKADTTLSVTTVDSLHYGINIGLRCKPGFDIGVRNIETGWLRPGGTAQLNIGAGDFSAFFNANCASGTGGVVTLTMQGPVSYMSPAVGALTPANVTGQTITWNVSDFGIVKFDSSFNILIGLATGATSGQQVCFVVSVTPTSGDNATDNNTLTQCFTVHASFDPNEMEVYPPEGKITPTDPQWLTYTVHFQNTGTDTALNVSIADTLSNNLDISSFQLIGYSSKVVAQIFPSGLVKFTFPGIYLPDSATNEARSKGFVQYKVKLKPNLTSGTQVENGAYIYFDFNSPVATNHVINTICNSISTDINVSICSGSSYTFFGTSIASAGDYSHNKPDQVACDTLFNLHLNILPPPVTHYNTSICSGDSFSFSLDPSYHKIDNQKFTINPENDTLTSYRLSPHYNSSGDYSDTVKNMNGCDSIVTVHLTVDTIEAAVVNVKEDSITVSGNGKVKWIDCNTGLVVDSGTAGTYSFTRAGIYAAIFSNGNCSDTTVCIPLLATGVAAANGDFGFNLFPNPAIDKVNIQTGAFVPNLITIIDADGRKISEQKFKPVIDVSALPAGLYFIEVKNSDTVLRNKLIKQ